MVHSNSAMPMFNRQHNHQEVSLFHNLLQRFQNATIDFYTYQGQCTPSSQKTYRDSKEARIRLSKSKLNWDSSCFTNILTILTQRNSPKRWSKVLIGKCLGHLNLSTPVSTGLSHRCWVVINPLDSQMSNHLRIFKASSIILHRKTRDYCTFHQNELRTSSSA